ncbi:helix-turn-helix domain-containing protein [Cohnella suwonensis]|uniref:Helix-turn-helix domain-containing protein n=1 Tax=Cohnella suwonensis TaxID=696072 RepID=A0ABW0LRV8_9BACL
MKPVRAMIVDDEVLAIEHIRQLVPWERLGYEIVCTADRPSQVPELVRKHRPELVIIDIVMPGMDGLTLSKQLLADGLTVKIVLLTSYKEFDYAKEALQLGLSNYWVKHEMDAETLTRELESLLRELENDRRRREEERSRLLGNWLAGGPASDKIGPVLMAGRDTGAGIDYFHLIVLQPDRPFALLAGLAPASAVAELPSDWPEEAAEGLLAAVRMKEHHFALVFGDSGGRGEGKMRELLEERAAAARDRMERLTGGTASIAVASNVRGYAEIPGKVAESLHWLSLSVFFRPRHTFRLNDMRPDNSKPKRLAWEDGVGSIRDMLSAQRHEDAATALAELFDEAAKSLDLAGFSDMCRQLAAMLNRSRAAASMPSFHELSEQGGIPFSSLTSCEAIRSWLLSEMEAIASGGKMQNAYSRKVREALDYMEKRYADEEVGADSIARHLGISRDHFRHVFKEETGQTVLERLTDIRMGQAKRMLEEGKFKVYEIAERVGFRNSQYFSQVFRKTTGMNPLEYMEKPR